MTLLVHLRVLTVWRLWVTAAVTTWTVVDIAGGGAILSHSLSEPWALSAILRPRSVTRGSRLISDRRQLRMPRCWPRYAYCLSHLTVDRSIGGVVVGCAAFGGTLSLLFGLALGFLLLFLGFPFFANFFEFCEVAKLATYNTDIKKCAKRARQGSTAVSSRHLKLSGPAGTPSK